jgi:hypothetical protein
MNSVITALASEAVGVGDPLYISANGTCSRADADDELDDDAANVIGVAANWQKAGGPVIVVYGGVAANVLSGAKAGTRYWLKCGGGMSPSFPTSDQRMVQIGFAFNETDLLVLPQDFGVRA